VSPPNVFEFVEYKLGSFINQQRQAMNPDKVAISKK